MPHNEIYVTKQHAHNHHEHMFDQEVNLAQLVRVGGLVVHSNHPAWTLL
jgi:hypothetical protein